MFEQVTLTFAESLEAVKDVWLIGDRFLKNIYHTFPAMRREAKLAKKEPPYLYRYYNVKYFVPDTSEYCTNALLRLQNVFIDALNNNRLPRLILIFIDRDLIDSFGNDYVDYEVRDSFGKIIDKLTSNLYQICNTKKLDMYNKRPGSISPSEPKLIWIRMIQHYNPQDMVCALTYKLNNLLEEALAEKRHHYVLGVDGCLSKNSFDRNFGLRVTAVIDVWNEIDHQIELFDKQQINLRPVVQAALDDGAHGDDASISDKSNFRKLPRANNKQY